MNKLELLAALAPEIKDVEVKALGTSLRFKVLTGRARDALYSNAVANADTSHYEASLIAASVVDSDGSPMFSPEDVDTLRDSNSTLLTELAGAAMAVNKLGADAEKAAVKN
jgi:hypothetical protein